MAYEPDMVGTAFFATGAIFLLCLTRWPRLWIAMSFNRRWATEEFRRKGRILPMLTGIGALLGIYAALRSYFGF